MQVNKDLLKLVAENPDLPIVAMVDGNIVEDPAWTWMGSFAKALVSEIGFIGERFYDDRDDFKDAYYDKHDEELDKKFNYNACLAITGDPAANANGAQLEAYLDKIADEYMVKAIVVYVGEPDMSIFMEAD